MGDIFQNLFRIAIEANAEEGIPYAVIGVFSFMSLDYSENNFKDSEWKKDVLFTAGVSMMIGTVLNIWWLSHKKLTRKSKK